MCRLIESICIQDGTARHLDYHEGRMQQARQELWGIREGISLRDQIRLSPKQWAGKLKCRVLYSRHIEAVELVPYTVRSLRSFRLVQADYLRYAHKYEDRQWVSRLKTGVFEDEIILLQENCITDTSYSNLVFYDGKQWVTPSTPLLPGVMRQSLLDTGKIKTTRLTTEDLSKFSAFKLINAMMNLEESPTYPISCINTAVKMH